MTKVDDEPDLTILLPAYNEAEVVLPNLQEIRAYILEQMPGTSFEILVVDDGSTDGMGDAVAAEAARHDYLRLVRHRTNLGRGRAIRTGLENARGRFVICLDADLSYAPNHIERLLRPLHRDEADITLASAYHPQGSVANVPTVRALLSRWGNRILSSSVYGQLHTVTCMVRGYRREAIEDLELINDGKDLHLEIIQKASLLRLRIKEVPADLVWRDRKRNKRVPKGRLIDRIFFLSMSSTIASHLVYKYVLRPGSLLNLPVIGLLLFSIIMLVMLLVSWLYRLFWTAKSVSLSSAYSTLRETLLTGGLTAALMIASLLICIIFVAFYFASQQNKKNFEETYILMMRMNARLKRLEKKVGG